MLIRAGTPPPGRQVSWSGESFGCGFEKHEKIRQGKSREECWHNKRGAHCKSGLLGERNKCEAVQTLIGSSNQKGQNWLCFYSFQPRALRRLLWAGSLVGAATRTESCAASLSDRRGCRRMCGGGSWLLLHLL